jgi:hypothetical protein
MKLFDATIGFPGLHLANVVSSSDGNSLILFAGSNPATLEFGVTKFNTSGVIFSSLYTCLNSSQTFYPRGYTESSDGNWYFVGYTNQGYAYVPLSLTAGSVHEQANIIKMGSDGSIQWSKVYTNGTEVTQPELYAISETDEGSEFMFCTF